MRAEMTASDATPAILPTRYIAQDLDFLAARLHGRRSRMAEGERLDGLCRIGGLEEFFRTIFPEFELPGSTDFQRLLVHGLVREFSRLRAYMSGPGADFIDWTIVRFQVENLKILIRAWFLKTPIEEAERHLVALPPELTLDVPRLSKAELLRDFVRLLPEGILRENLEKTLKIYPDHPRPFFFEAALDRGYFTGLLERMERLAPGDLETVKPMVYQEADTFQLMLVARGRFHYGLAPDTLRPLRVGETRIPRAVFVAMLSDPDLVTAAGRVVGRVIDRVLPEGGSGDASTAADAALLERLAWKRYLRLANEAFRHSHMGLGAIVGYTGLRRIEAANLITICEGIRSGMAAETLRGHLISRSEVEGAHV
jgi:V/A-type H+/Na+-transporting ATPase subunit C